MQLQLPRWLPVSHNQEHHFENWKAIYNMSWKRDQDTRPQHICTLTTCCQAGPSLGSDRPKSCVPIPQQPPPSTLRRTGSAAREPEAPQHTQTVFNSEQFELCSVQSYRRQRILILTEMKWSPNKNPVQEHFKHILRIIHRLFFSCHSYSYKRKVRTFQSTPLKRII